MIRLASAAVAFLAAGVGCYQPTLRDCTVECSAATDCAGDQVCRAGWCTSEGASPCRKPGGGGGGGGGTTVDGSMAAPDDGATGTGDANDLCIQGCSNGTCIAGVCVIDCSAAESCSNDVVCPTNLPCRVVCGDDACTNKVNCEKSLDCTVDCVGELSCHGEIICPADYDCEVTCSGAGACGNRTKCSNACSCDVTCSGPGSCDDPSDCPSDACRVGNGCSSFPAGCNTCG